MRRRHPAGTAPLEGLAKTEKRCRTCGVVKPMTSEFFPRDANQPDGFQGWCKLCKQAEQRRNYTTEKGRAQWLKRKFGLTPEAYQELLASVDHKCQICGADEGASKRNRKWTALSIDHVHESDEIRGVLCDRCNPGIGMFKDDPELLEAAAAYLRAFQPKRPVVVVEDDINVWQARWLSPVTKRESDRWFVDTPEIAHRAFPSKRAALTEARRVISRRKP